MATIQVVNGFSELNRALMYLSAILAPAQAMAGIGHSGISSLGFLAYNYYTQIVWYRAARDGSLSALALVAVHANTTLAIAYLGGIFSANRTMAALLSLGAMGVLWLNNATAWVSWKTGQEAGFDEWQFFFFGWRKLTYGWHMFLMVWQISNSLESFALSVVIASIAIWMIAGKKDEVKKKFQWWHRFPAVLVGGAMMTFVVFPYIIWIELIIRRNHIESETDWAAVYVFIGQVALLFLPDLGRCTSYFKRNGDNEDGEAAYYSLRNAVGYTGSLR